MSVACNHTIHRKHHHFGWNRDFTPTVRAKPGETIHFECLDSSGKQLGRNSTVSDVVKLDFAKVNPVTGPVNVEGAEPGDALKVTIRRFEGVVDFAGRRFLVDIMCVPECESVLFGLGLFRSRSGRASI